MSFSVTPGKFISQQLQRTRHFHRNSPIFQIVFNSSPATESILSKDLKFMKLALRHAQHAYRDKEVPIGAVLVDENGTIVAGARNMVEERSDATAHAEINCLREAGSLLNNWRLKNTTLYTTLEPCTMCLSALQSFRVKRVVFAASDLRLGACGSYINLVQFKHPYHEIEVTGGVCGEESAALLRRFFSSIRQEKFRYGSFDLGRGITY